MVTTIHLVRHGRHGLLGKLLCGRMPGVDLDASGREDMRGCAAAMNPAPQVIQSSPQPRTRQSAAILSAQFGPPVEIVAAWDEIDMGDWTGLRFDDLARDPRWREWNERRGSSRPPSGESMRELQDRVVQHIQSLSAEDRVVAIVSHAEPIRAALLYYTDRPLDEFWSLQVEPASISTLIIDRERVTVGNINQTVPA